MPRIARAVAEGFPHHVIQRGNNRADIFFDEEDRRQYLRLVKKYSEKWSTSMFAYCLMTNHCHILIRPSTESALYKMMQGVTLCYTQHVNRKYGRTGRLWESRYHSCIVNEEKYLWAVARYIEQNPVRAGIVSKAEDYDYSSARAHVKGTSDEVLGEELFTNDRRQDYIKLLRSGTPEEEKEAVRYCTRTGRPFGDEVFICGVEQSLKRRLAKRPQGRPKRKE